MSDQAMSAMSTIPRAAPARPGHGAPAASAGPAPVAVPAATLPDAGRGPLPSDSDSASAPSGSGGGQAADPRDAAATASLAGALPSGLPPSRPGVVHVAGLSSRPAAPTAADSAPPAASAARPATMPHSQRALRLPAGVVIIGLAVLLAVTAALALSLGASGLSLWQAASRTLSPAEEAILYNIRLPRLVLGGCVGAGLAVSGAIMQGLFRNPLADPGLVGVSAGGALGAITAIVLGGLLPVWLQARLGGHLVAVMAFAGAWATMMILYRIARSRGRVSMATLLLAGIVLGALASAIAGIMVFLADDRQLRDLTFWGLGSLAGASWVKVATAGPLLVVSVLLAPMLARGLNALALGEAAARHMGISVERTKTASILLVSAAAGAAVAVSGGIGFVGIVVPHLLRLVLGPDHRTILPASALLGAALLIGADTVSRLLVAPAELPIGIVMALIGAPVFLWVLLSRRQVIEA